MKMKKLLVTLLALIFILGTVSTGFAAPLKDVEGTDYEDAVARLVALGIIGGYPDGTYKPEKPVTRAEFAKIIVTALGVGQAAEYAKGATKFSDVPATHWASGYINVATDMGVINGYPDGTFKPNKEVSYAEAITMIVRALGYEPKAKALGGYPGGYLAVAAEKDITEDITVVNSLAASRGDIALMVNKAVEVPMMVQKTWGQYPEYEEDEDETLLSKLGVEEVEGRVTAIPRTDSKLDDDEIKIGKETYTVVANIDFEELYGLEVTALVNDDDEVIGVEIDSDYYLDAIDVSDKGDELTLVDADEDYDIAEDVVVYVNGEEKDSITDADNADYAKVVLNDDDEVVFVDAYKWDGYLVVEKIDDDIIYSYDEELDVEDYTIVKDGKTISIDDIKKGDIVFYDEGAEYIEVFIKSVEGEIEKVFSNAFRLDNDEDYDIAGKYLDDDELKALDADALESMQEEGPVVVYLDRAGNVVFVDGDLGEPEEDTIAGYLTRKVTIYQDNRDLDYYFAIDMINENGEEVSYDVKAVDVDVDEIIEWATNTANKTDVEAVAGVDKQETEWADYTDSEQDALIEAYITGTYGWGWTNADTEIVPAGTVIEITMDEDGDITELAFNLSKTTIDGSDVDVTEAKYVEGKKVKSSTVVFIVEDYLASGDEDDIEVVTWGNIDDFELIKDATAAADDSVVYYDSDGYATYIVAKKTDRDIETTDYTVLVTDVRKVQGEDVWRIKAYVDGEEKVFYTDEDKVSSVSIAENDYAVLTIDDKSELVTAIGKIDSSHSLFATSGLVTARDVSDKAITVSGAVYELVDEGYVYDITGDDVEVITVRDIEVNKDTVAVILDEAGTFFAKMFVVTDTAEEETTTESKATITSNYVLNARDTVNVKLDLASGETEADYVLQVFEGSTLAATATFSSDAVGSNGQDFVVDDSTPSGADLVLESNKAYTIKVVKVTDGTVLATKDVTTGDLTTN